MHHTQALKTLLQCLEDLTGTVETFGQEQKLHEVEKDLVLYRGRLLYEAILKLPTAVAETPTSVENVQLAEEIIEVATAKAVEVLPSEEPIAAEVEVVDEVEVPTAEAADAINEEVVSQESETTTQEPEIEISRPNITMTQSDEALETEAEAMSRVKAVQFEKFSIAAVLQQSGDKDLILTHLKLKPIQDLKSGIGLNEKFLFIRELFENDHQAYAQAVDAINGSESLQDAEAYISNDLLPRYGWELEKEALLNFLHLILRRFSNG